MLYHHTMQTSHGTACLYKYIYIYIYIYVFLHIYIYDYTYFSCSANANISKKSDIQRHGLIRDGNKQHLLSKACIRILRIMQLVILVMPNTCISIQFIRVIRN